MSLWHLKQTGLDQTNHEEGTTHPQGQANFSKDGQTTMPQRVLGLDST